ncbi:MAG: hypothetical protein J6T55_03830 [Alphaproteobacteria bacterium]|nr:hypothetical protein [Alphaproteobacteria bacterium]
MDSKIFLFLVLALCSGHLAAQTDNETLALFPDLASISTSSEETTTNLPEEKSQQESLKDVDLFIEEGQTPLTNKKDEQLQSQTEEEEEDGEEAILLNLDDPQGVLTPDRKSSYCSATFKAINKTKKKLNLLSGQFTVGTTTHPFEFKNIEKEQTKGVRYLFLGLNCEKILATPQVDVRSCQLEKVSEAKCKKLVRYTTLPNQK